MPTVILRPNATTSNTWTLVGGADADDVTKDNSDASYLEGDNAVQVHTVRVQLDDITVPATDQIRSIIARVRAVLVSGPSRFLRVSVQRNSDLAFLTLGDVTPTTTITTHSTPASTVDFDGEAWTDPEIDDIRFVIEHLYNAGVSTVLRVHEIYLDVLTNTRPTVTVTDPTEGGTTNDDTPAVKWTYSDTEGDGQERYQVKIFDSATYGAGGFDPETSTPTLTSGEVFSSAKQHTFTTALADGTYRAYVKVSDAGSNGRYSLWDFNQFTVSVDRPAIPTITLADQDSYVELTVLATINRLTYNQASLETNTTGWAADANCSIARSTAQAAHLTASLSMTSSASGAMAARTPTGTSGVPVAGGSTYTVVAEFRAATVARACLVKIRWYNSAGTFISESSGSTVLNTTTGFTQASLTAAAPATAAFAAVIVQVNATGGASEVHYVDKIGFGQGSSTAWTIGGYSGVQYTIERSLDGSTGWTEITRSPESIGTSTSQVVTRDYEAPYQTVYYRAITEGANPITTNTVSSSYSSNASLSFTTTADWYLKDVTSGAETVLDLSDAVVGPSQTLDSGIDQAVFGPIGRDTYVTVNDQIRAERFTLELEFTTRSAFNAFEALRNTKRTLLLQRAWTNDQWYIQMGDRSWTIQNLDPPLHQVSIPCVEVAAP